MFSVTILFWRNATVECVLDLVLHFCVCIPEWTGIIQQINIESWEAVITVVLGTTFTSFSVDCINLLSERIRLALFCYLKGAGRRKKAAAECQRLDKYWMAPGRFQSCSLWNPHPVWVALPVGFPSFNSFNSHSLIHTLTGAVWGS